MGQQLFEARQRRNLSLADISRTTKIPIHLLESIERNDVDHLPQGFFTRAFVRAYANEVGVNPDEVLDNIEQPEIEQVEMEQPTTKVAVEEPSSSRSLFFVLALAAACSTYFGFASRTPAPQASPVATEVQLADTARRRPPQFLQPRATS